MKFEITEHRKFVKCEMANIKIKVIEGILRNGNSTNNALMVDGIVLSVVAKLIFS